MCAFAAGLGTDYGAYVARTAPAWLQDVDSNAVRQVGSSLIIILISTPSGCHGKNGGSHACAHVTVKAVRHLCMLALLLHASVPGSCMLSTQLSHASVQVLSKAFLAVVALLDSFWRSEGHAPGEQAARALGSLAWLQFCRLRTSVYSSLLKDALSAVASSPEVQASYLVIIDCHGA